MFLEHLTTIANLPIGDCPYASGTHDTMVSHRKKKHPLAQGEMIQQVSVQHLFTSVGKVYFIVSPSLKNDSPESLFSHLITDVLPKMPQLPAQIPATSRDVLPLHRVTKWWEILGLHALSKKAQKSVISLAGPAREQGLSALPGLCQQYLVQAQTASKSAGYTVRKQLVPEE